VCYIVAFTKAKVLTMYQICHTWPPLRLSFIPSPNSWNSFNEYHFLHFCMCIHYLHHIQIFILLPPSPHLPPYSGATPPISRRWYSHMKDLLSTLERCHSLILKDEKSKLREFCTNLVKTTLIKMLRLITWFSCFFMTNYSLSTSECK
jgi:hypothetical protein